MGALGILQEKSVGKDAEQSNDTLDNVEFDGRIFQLTTSSYTKGFIDSIKIYSFKKL